MFKTEILLSHYDGLKLEMAVMEPEGTPVGIVQIAHGMAEHKERYQPFMTWLAEQGYVAVIHDHRGHGSSVKQKEDHGYFYTQDAMAIVHDLYQVSVWCREQYPGLPLYLFAHSMGTLVARNYLKQYDTMIDKLILCGPPTRNPLVRAARILATLSASVKGEKHRSAWINRLVFGSYNRGHQIPNGWLSGNRETVSRYNADKQCGFVFTNNGFINLFKLLENAYSKTGWQVMHPDLPVLIIAGEKDPVIQNTRRFHELAAFLKDRGYTHITTRLYPDRWHELLNETNREEVYCDVLRFIRAD